MNELKLKHKQRGSVGISVFANAAHQSVLSTGVITLTGATIEDVSNGVRTYTARLWIKLDGTTDKTENTTTTQINSGADWCIPNSASESEDYEVRYTSRTGDAPGGNLTEDTWADIDADKTVTLSGSLASEVSEACTFTVEIRINGGAVIDSASYTLHIENLF